MPFYERGNVRIHYQEVGSGFPLLLIPGGGLNSTIWGPALVARRPDITMKMIERFLHNMYRSPADFVFTVTRDFVRSCQTPMLVLPDDTPPHPLAISREIVSLAPKAEASIYPWKESKDTIRKVVDHVRTFLKAHEPVTSR